MIGKQKLSGAITSEDVLGKDVIDSRGAFIGVSDKLYLDPRTLAVLGISVDKGFLRSGLLIGTKYIKEVTEHAVMLHIEPAFQIKGMEVFDTDGALVGTVQGVVLRSGSNSVRSLQVKPRKLGTASYVIPAEFLHHIEDNVLLSVTVQTIAATASRATTPKKE